MEIRFSKAAWLLVPVTAAGIAGFFLLNRDSPEDPARDEMVRSLAIHQSRHFDRPRAEAEIGTTGVGFDSVARDTAVDAQLKLLDPSRENWETELLSDAAARVLKLVFAPGPGFGLPFENALTDDFRVIPTEAPPLRAVYEYGGLSVQRASVPEGAEGGRADPRIPLPFAEDPPGQIKFKIVRIENSEQGFSTRLLVKAVHGTAGGPAIQITSTWRAEWTHPGDGESAAAARDPESGEPLPRLRALRILEWERVERRSATPLFEDITEAVVPEGFTAHHYPLNHWASRMTRIDDTGFFGYHGLAIGDADGDGLDDLYVCETGGLPNRLFLQNQDGTLRDASEKAGVDWLEHTRSALFADLDNDGDQDLVVVTVALLLVMENRGDGTFALDGGFPGLSDPYSVSAADYDNDGDLDIHVCNYGAGRSGSGDSGFEASQPMPYNDAKNGGRNVLLKNAGGLRFADAAGAVGLDRPSERRWSYAASWEDYDNDGDQDLYVANDFGRNNLFRNDGGRFVDVAGEAGVEDMATGMSIAWGDVNRDGHMDAYVANMYSSAGGRIAYQRQFGEKLSDGVEGFQRMARGNTLFLARGDGRTFRDTSESDGVNMGQWAWSSQIADLNNDGWQDIVVSNGYLTNQGASGRDL